MRLSDFLPWQRGEAPEARDAGDDRWFDGPRTRAEIDVTVTVDRARQVPVVRDCLQILSQSVAGLRFGVFRQVGGDRTERADDHPVMALLRNPNARMTSFDLIDTLVDDLCAWGDFFGLMQWGADGRRMVVTGLTRLDPGRVTVEETPDGTKRYTFTDRHGTQSRYLEGEVWHVALPPLVDGIKGRSPILDDGREAVAVAIALQRYANALFTNDATPPYALAMDGSFRDEASKRNFLTAWRRWVTGRNRHAPGVLEYGIKPHRMGLTAEEAQFLETRKELWLDLARLWRVPPHKVGILDRATFSNIEHQALEFVTDTLRPILELVERSINKFLIDADGRDGGEHFFEFDVSSLLRGDLKARYDAYAIGRQWGWLSVNDVLAMENRNGIGPSGDRYIEPLNMVPVGTGAGLREPENREAVNRSIAFLRESVARNGGRPRLEVVRDVA